MTTVKAIPDLLFIPPITNPVLKDQVLNFIPVGLLALLASLSRKGYSASIYVPHFKLITRQDFNEVAQDILEMFPKAIGFSTWCNSYPVSLLIASEIKTLNPEIPVILGGPQVSVLADKTLEKFPFVDYVIRGEADYSLSKLLDIILNENSENNISDVAGLTYRDPKDNQKIIANPSTDKINNLDNLPIPLYDRIYNKSSLILDTGRGCPFHCTYCSTSQFFSNSYRTKSVKRVLGEVDYCYTKIKARFFGFSHDMIALNKNFVFDLCYGLNKYFKKKKKTFGWTCSARTDCVSTDMLKRMVESGCQGIFFGIETGSEQMQKKIRKNLNLSDAVKKVKYAISRGIQCTVSYMAGFPGESREDLNKTLNSILQMSISGAKPQMTLLALLPGTPMYNDNVRNLKFDGKISGFVDSFIPEPLMDLIRTDPEVFSPFFYLENAVIRRETYLFVSSMVNLLNNFIPTLVSLKNHLIKDIHQIDLLYYIEEKIPDYINNDSISEPELFLLLDSINRYLNFLRNRGLSIFYWEIFQADFIKASVLSRYIKWQNYRLTNHYKPKNIRTIKENYLIRVNPFWRVFKSKYYIYDYMKDSSIIRKNKTPRKGNFTYLVVPISDRETEILKVPGKYVRIIRHLKDMMVSDFICFTRPELDKRKSMKLLQTMLKLNMIEISD